MLTHKHQISPAKHEQPSVSMLTRHLYWLTGVIMYQSLVVHLITSEVIFSPPQMNTPHMTLNMTLRLDNPQRITPRHYITVVWRT